MRSILNHIFRRYSFCPQLFSIKSKSYLIINKKDTNQKWRVNSNKKFRNHLCKKFKSVLKSLRQNIEARENATTF